MSIFENIENPAALATINDSGVTAEVLDLKVKRGKETITVRVSNPALVTAGVDAFKMYEAGKVSAKALCIILARLSLEDIKKAGFKSIAEYATAIITDLSANQVNQYRRVGLIFGNLSADGYYWREMVGQSVSATNLSQVTKHFFKTADGKPTDLEALTEKEINALYAGFIKEYITTGKLVLTDTLDGLRKQISDLEKVVADVNYEEVNESAEAQTEAQTESRYESGLEHIKALKVLFAENKTALKALESLVKALDTLK